MFSWAWAVMKPSPVSVSLVADWRSTWSAYGYVVAVVYPSRIHRMCPSTTAGYGSPSMVRNGATFCTRSRGSRTYMIFEFGLKTLEIRKLVSRYLYPYRTRRQYEPTEMPPEPSYVTYWSAEPVG